MSLADQILESEPSLEFRIAEQELILGHHPNRSARAEAFKRLQELHKQRTPEQVRKMEIQKGLVKA